jgi:regulator of extracellular matrix RemA (YlzA/DUF370 family)
MQAFSFSEPDGTFIRHRITDSDDRVKIHAAEFVRQFRAARMLDSDLPRLSGIGPPNTMSFISSRPPRQIDSRQISQDQVDNGVKVASKVMNPSLLL